VLFNAVCNAVCWWQLITTSIWVAIVVMRPNAIAMIIPTAEMP
jgi:hypothetical protein